MTTKISSGRETVARMDQRIAEEPNPKYKRWMQVNRDHFWGEIIGDVDMVMRTMTRGPIYYSYDGHPFMKPDGDVMSQVTCLDTTRQMYAGIQAAGARAAGPMDDERFMLDDRGLYVRGLLTAIFPGAFITQHHEPIDPAELYLVRVVNTTMVEFDEEGLMKGEQIMNGAPQLVKRVDASMIDRLIDGPIIID